MIFKVILLTVVASVVNAQGGNIVVPATGKVTFRSPNYPDRYGNNLNVIYNITGPADGVGIQFDAEDFSLEGRYCYDYISFSETINGVSVAIHPTPFCGTDGPSRLKSTTNTVTVLFKTDSLYTSTGFKISAQAALCPVDKDVCPGDHTSCLAISQYCDGVEDCPSGADEKCHDQCGNPIIPPTTSRFSQVKAQLTSRIVGGTEATPHSWPWQVAILRNSNKLLCGGAIIDNLWILTAAHCCLAVGPFASNYKVRIGAHIIQSTNEISAKTVRLERVEVHPDYDDETKQQDFCLLKTIEPMVFSAQVAPVCLADPVDGRIGQKCWISGWGSAIPKNQTHSMIDRSVTKGLRQVDVGIIDQAKCSKDYNPAIVTPQMICAEAPGHDNCQGDNGGPLVCQDDSGAFKHVGVISWGYGCADPRYPGVYARTSSALDWIASTIYS